MDKLRILLGVIVFAIILLGANQIGTYQEQLDLKRIKLETIQEKHESTLKQLEETSAELDRAREDVDTSQETIEQLEAEKQRLESELQAKRAKQNKRVAYAAEQTITGTKAEWLAQSNIKSTDYKYVDFIVQKESGWRYDVWNSQGSSAYGLCQTMTSIHKPPQSFYNDPIEQLNWCNNYALSRYNSWANAYEFWLNNNYW